MKDTLLKCRSKPPEPNIEILRLVDRASTEVDIPVFMIGAFARDLILEYVYQVKIRRRTEDIDFGVAVRNWDEYENLKKTLVATSKFKEDKRIEHRIWWKSVSGEMKIDLVPFGEIESPKGEIAFPPSGDFVMITTGFEEVWQNALILEAEIGLRLKVATLAGLSLLKFIAYNDRPRERTRDVQDIWFIAQKYLEAGNEQRLYEEAVEDADLLLEEDFDYETCGARLLGRDIGAITNQKTLDIILRSLSEDEPDEAMQKFADIINRDHFYEEESYQKIMQGLRELKKWISERIQTLVHISHQADHQFRIKVNTISHQSEHDFASR